MSYDPRFGSDWNVPPPPPQPRQPGQIRGGRVALGIGIASAAHIAVIAIGLILLFSFDDERALNGLVVGLVGEVVVFIVCLTLGIVFLAKTNGDKGLGLGLLIGWAVGVIVFPVIGFGVCVAVLSGQGAPL